MVQLTTARLLLRPLTADDFDAHYAVVASDPAVTWDGEVQSPAKAAALMDARLRHWAAHGFGMWAAIDRVSHALLGHGGLQYLEDGPEVELGYYLARAAWGRGLATELARAAVRHGFEALQLPRIAAVVRHDNTASQRVLAKLGFRHTHDAHHHGRDVQYWRLTPAELRAASG